MKLVFREKASIAVAQRLLNLQGAPMHYVRLLNLMYLIERASLLECENFITFAQCISGSYGLIPGEVLSLIQNRETSEYWKECFSDIVNDEITVEKQKFSDELSKYDIDLIEKIYDAFKEKDLYLIQEYMSHLPEFSRLNNSVDFSKSLAAAGFSIEDIQDIFSEISQYNYSYEHLAVK